MHIMTSLAISLIGIILSVPSYSNKIGIIDNAALFTSDAIEIAKGTLEEIKYLHNSYVMVETLRHIPVGAERGEQGKKEVTEWFEKRHGSIGLRNLRVLITVEPPYIVVAAGKTLKETGEFTESDREGLLYVISERVERGENAEALLMGLHYIKDVILGLRDDSLLQKKSVVKDKDFWLYLGAFLVLLGLILAWLFFFQKEKIQSTLKKLAALQKRQGRSET